MLSCKEITELAAARAEDALEAELRAQFDLHVAGCHGCQAWLRQVAIAAGAIRLVPPPALPAALEEQLLGRFDEWLASRAGAGAPALAHAVRAGGHHRWEALVAVVGVAALLVGMARHPSRAAADWVVAGGLAAGAVAIALLARRLTPRFALAAVSASLVATAIRGGPGPLEPAEGLECLVIEVAAAAAVAGIAWLAGRRGPGPLALGPWAVAGALSGSAALQLACGAHASLAHLLVFHVGGVTVVAAVALAGARLRPQPA